MIKLAKNFFLAIILIILIFSCSKKEIYVLDEGQENTILTIYHEKENVEKLVFEYDTAIHKIELGKSLEELKKGKYEKGINYKVKVKKNDTVILIKTIDFKDKNLEKSEEYITYKELKDYAKLLDMLKKIGFVKK